MFKKLLFKVVLLAGLMLLLPYYLLGGGTMPGFLQDLFKTAKKTPVPMTNMNSVTTDKAVTLYKCVSETGRVEFSQSPCLGDSEKIELNPNVNVVQRTQVNDEEEDVSEGGSIISLGSSDKEKAAGDKKDGGVELGNPYDPDNVQKLIKDAQNVGKLMEQHTKQIEQVTGNKSN